MMKKMLLFLMLFNLFQISDAYSKTFTEAIRTTAKDVSKYLDKFLLEYLDKGRSPSDDTDSDSDSDKASSMRLGDKWYMYNKLTRIFGEDKNQPEILLEYLFPYAQFFGGSCSTVELSSLEQQSTRFGDSGSFKFYFSVNDVNRCFTSADVSTPLTLKSNVARQGLMIQICYEMVLNNESGGFDHVYNNLCSGRTCVWNSSNVIALHKLFYPYNTLFDESEAEDLMSKIDDEEYDSHELLQILTYIHCVDPNWQSM